MGIWMAVVFYTIVTAVLVGCAECGDDGDQELSEDTAKYVDTAIQLVNSLNTTLQGFPIARRGRADTSEVTRRAIERLDECETDLDDARMTALRDLFTLNETPASAYLGIKRDTVRKAWIQGKLTKMGFPSEDLYLGV